MYLYDAWMSVILRGSGPAVALSILSSDPYDSTFFL